MSEPLDLDAIQARADAAGNSRRLIKQCQFLRVTPSPHSHDVVAKSQGDVPTLIARVRELETRNTNLGIARVRAADALDRVALYGKNLTEVFKRGTAEHEVGVEILRRITTNPLPSEGGPL